MPTGALGSASGRHPRRFAPSDRLRKRFEFRRVRDVGRRVHTPSFVLLVAPGEVDQARLGITVSRQVGKATRRNRIKRLVRESFRQHRELFPERTEVVVIAKAGCTLSSLAAVHAELLVARSAMRKAAEKAGARRGGAA